LLVKGSS